MIYSDSVPDYDVSHQLRLLFLHRLSCYFTLSPPLNDALLYLREENYKESVHVSYKDDYKESVYITYTKLTQLNIYCFPVYLS